MEDRALIKRLAAEACRWRERQEVRHREEHSHRGRWPRTVRKYERKSGPTSFTPNEVRMRQLLAEVPGVPPTILAGRVGLTS